MKETVYLVDGSSYIHRAFHAVRDLTTSQGFPSNAVFGFTKMVLKLLADKAPRYLAIVFDAKGPTFRHEIYPAYKANRPPMPEDLAAQIPLIKKVVRYLNVATLEKEGYEADDLIGTLARRCEKAGFEVVMVTGDKDFRQLITPGCSMWDPMKGQVMDYPSLLETYKLEPSQLIDVMGLSGDTSDNIPGVRGVGEKTALNLIQQYGSMEKVFEHLQDVKGKKLQERLETHQQEALLSRRLVVIDCQVPIEMETDLESLRMGEPQKEELARIFRELEFRDLWERFAPRQQEQGEEYALCLSLEDLGALVATIQKAGRVCLDTETTGRDPMQARLVGISFSCREGHAIYLPLAHHYLGAPEQIPWNEARERLREVLEDPGILKIGQNIKYDAQILRRNGVDLQGIHFDTMIASYVINPGLRQHNLDYLAQHYLNRKMISYKEVAGDRGKSTGLQGVELEKACAYSCEDADVTLRLQVILDRKLKEDQGEGLFYQMEMKLVPVLMDMEMAGIRIDAQVFQEMSRRFAEELARMEAEIYREAGMTFNINSPQQLGVVLFEKLQLPGQKKTARTGHYSTDVKVLKALAASAFEMPRLLLRYRQISKLKSTYLDTLVRLVHPETGRLHTSFNQTVTATGRLSSSNPNLQNIPVRKEEGKEIRRGFVADPGHLLVSADYSQIELRVFAHYSGDPAFLEAFQNNEDIHAKTAGEILAGPGQAVTPDMRRIAKAINFGIIYGMGPRKLSEELGIDLKAAKEYIHAYYQRYQGVTRYREEMIRMARNQGYVATLFNRRRYLPEIQKDNQRERAEAERMAINTPIQGTAADLIKKAMIRIHSRLKQEGFRARMLLQVHDELVFEAPESEVENLKHMVREEMEGVYPLSVPLRVDIQSGRNWDEAH